LRGAYVGAGEGFGRVKDFFAKKRLKNKYQTLD
jgi:hypothetical protein